MNRTGWAASAAEAALRAARASAALDGAELARADGVVTDPVLAGAVRAAEATGHGSLGAAWRTRAAAGAGLGLGRCAPRLGRSSAGR